MKIPAVVAVAAVIAAAAADAAAVPGFPGGGSAGRAVGVAASTVRWMGPDGHTLPFESEAEVLEFLRTAEVVSISTLPKGWTRPQKALLEKDGVRAHAIFRSFQRVQDRGRDPVTGRVVADAFRDSAMSEAAAYELAGMLDLPFVPPTVRRILNNREGTLQLWIEGAMTETDRVAKGLAPPIPTWWRGVNETLILFDNLIFNADRNTGNLLIDGEWNVWFIDHTRAFQASRRLRNPEYLSLCERRLWNRLRSLTDEELEARLGPYLGGMELKMLSRRRDLLIERFEGMIRERGEDQVIFDFEHRLADWERRAP